MVFLLTLSNRWFLSSLLVVALLELTFDAKVGGADLRRDKRRAERRRKKQAKR